MAVYVYPEQFERCVALLTQRLQAMAARAGLAGLIAERTRLALAAKKASGAKLGNLRNLGEAAALGRRTLALEADRLAANVLPIVVDIRGTGVRGLGAIAAVLNRRGIRTARGGRWHVSTVQNLLRTGRPQAGVPAT